MHWVYSISTFSWTVYFGFVISMVKIWMTLSLSRRVNDNFCAWIQISFPLLCKCWLVNNGFIHIFQLSSVMLSLHCILIWTFTLLFYCHKPIYKIKIFVLESVPSLEILTQRQNIIGNIFSLSVRVMCFILNREQQYI